MQSISDWLPLPDGLIQGNLATAAEPPSAAQDLRQRLVRQEDQLVLDALRDNDFVRSRTAAVLGISERTLRNKLRRLRDEGLLETAADRRAEPAGQGV